MKLFGRTSTRASGAEGESLAAERLRRMGYRILETNYRCREGEIDIVARDGGTLVFIEVKARTSHAFGTPFDAVDGRKRRRILDAARRYLAERRIENTPIRFDVVGVRLGSSPPDVEVLAGAFGADDA